MTNELTHFANGQWARAYTYFGAHFTPQGCVFRLWAPHAAQVRLAGDFNGWQGAAMQRVDGGVWELTVAGVKVYDSYKYVVTGADGKVRWKADPYAFHAATRPDTNSKVFDIGGYTWGDGAWQERRGGADGPLHI